MKRWFHGVREHLVFTPQGYIAQVRQVAGNRHDVQGLYALLTTALQGCLLGDNAYWPRPEMRAQLKEHGLMVLAQTRSNWRVQYPPRDARWLRRQRGKIERRIGLFNQQFHAGRTLCRSAKHYHARRWTKALAHNTSRRLNAEHGWPQESTAHLRRAM